MPRKPQPGIVQFALDIPLDAKMRFESLHATLGFKNKSQTFQAIVYAVSTQDKIDPAALEAASALYGDTGFATRAARVRSTATRLGWDGEFFVDRAIRSDGRLVPAEDRTETCQYYAFYFGAATPASHPELWDLLVRKFGPRRPADDAYAHIAPANVLYGLWMRLELLARYGAREQMLDEARHLLLPMAGRTGTFWEHTDTRASCCHGFTSFVACLIKDAF